MSIFWGRHILIVFVHVIMCYCSLLFCLHWKHPCLFYHNIYVRWLTTVLCALVKQNFTYNFQPFRWKQSCYCVQRWQMINHIRIIVVLSYLEILGCMSLLRDFVFNHVSPYPNPAVRYWYYILMYRILREN